ncbi:MAG: protein kinase [Bryobacteraceae bacterium]
MSPEQVEGKPLDARSDLFSFGAVLYEMATGAPPFSGGNPAEIFDAILHKDPTPITRLSLALPDELARIITKCLQKERGVRYQGASEIRADFERLKRIQESLSRRRRVRRVVGLAVAFVFIALTGYVLTRRLPSPRVSGYVRISNDGQGKGGALGNVVTDGAHLYLAEGARTGFTTGFNESNFEPVQLTGGQLNSLAPVFSPDGKKLYVIGQQQRGELVRYDRRSGQWTPYLSGISAEFLDFSPDGQWVAYVDFPEGALWRSRIDGSERRKLTGPPMQVLEPIWSSNGKQIAFTGTSPGAPSTVYIVSSNGGNAEPVHPDGHNQVTGSWSPDGKFMLISSLYFLEATQRGVTVVRLPTHEAERLPGSEGVWQAKWSPNGRYIAARTLDSHAVMLFDSEKKRWSELSQSDIGYLSGWSRDGNFVYFKLLGNHGAIMRVNVKTRILEQVVSLANIKDTGYGGGVWIGLTPGNSPLLLRDTGAQEIYALDWQAP